MVIPYTDTKLTDTTYIRTFSNIHDNALVWHRDISTRVVVLLEGECYLMVDNDNPVNMLIGSEYTIPAYTWHKIIANCNKLVFNIHELSDF